MSTELLIDNCKKADVLAQKRLYETYRSMLYTVCRRYTSQKYEADDVFQDGFINILKGLKKFNYSNKSSFESWMRCIMRNTAINYLKKQKIRETCIDTEQIELLDDTNEEFNTDNIIEFIAQAELTDEELFSAIDELIPEYKIVFNLHIIDGLKHTEIAKILNIKENTSRARVSRSRKIVQKKLIEICHEKLNVNA